MTPVEHLHEETILIPVKEHNQLLSKQFFLGSFQPTRVDHHTVANEVNARNIRASLYIEFGKVEEITNGTKTVTAEQYKRGLKVLHYSEESSSRKIEASGRDSPEINQVEKEKLPRLQRTRLAQL